jgi:bifunctional DNase/RNase
VSVDPGRVGGRGWRAGPGAGARAGGAEGETMWVEMKVRGLALDPVSNMPIIILRDEEEKRSLPIWVGLFEANAIALELEKISTPRPMTHDLIKNILESVEAKVEKIVVNDLRDNTFFALIHLRLGDEEITVDSRPSDAIALALRVGAPIFVDEDVVRRARSVEVAPKEADDQEKLKEWLQNLKPEDFGKYKM